MYLTRMPTAGLKPNPHQRRLAACLLCSLLLHVVLLFFPMLGGSERFARPGAAGGPRVPAVLAARLMPLASIHDSTPAATRSEDTPAPVHTGERARTVENAVVAQIDHETVGANMLPAPSAVYYPTAMLSLRPQPIGETELDPPAIRPIVASGKVVLTVWIGPLGTVTRVQPVSADLPPNFVAAAVAGFQRQRFVPGELYGRAVGAVMKVEITYADGRQVSTEVAQ